MTQSSLVRQIRECTCLLHLKVSSVVPQNRSLQQLRRRCAAPSVAHVLLSLLGPYIKRPMQAQGQGQGRDSGLISKGNSPPRAMRRSLIARKAAMESPNIRISVIARKAATEPPPRSVKLLLGPSPIRARVQVRHRVSSQVGEAIVRANSGDVEYIAPNRGHHRLHCGQFTPCRGRRRHGRRRECAAVDLAGLGEWHGVEPYPDLGSSSVQDPSKATGLGFIKPGGSCKAAALTLTPTLIRSLGDHVRRQLRLAALLQSRLQSWRHQP